MDVTSREIRPTFEILEVQTLNSLQLSMVFPSIAKQRQTNCSAHRGAVKSCERYMSWRAVVLLWVVALAKMLVFS